MSRTAFVFPGQGSQYVGMGKDYMDVAREMFERADSTLGYKLSDICFEGPEDVLRQTEHTQPAIFLHSLVAAAQVHQPQADMVAGHSLGEYSALVHAGALSFEDGLRIVRLRGKLMQKAGNEQKGTMAAVVGLSMEILEEICSKASADGIVQPANFNSPGQIVISGSVAGVHKAMKLAKERGAKLAKELVVSGAFHSPLMQSATDGLREALAHAPMKDATIPVYANVTAEPVTRAEDIRDLLCRQITSPVRWEQTVRSLIRDGATCIFEIGPGKVLQGLVKRTDPEIEIKGIDKLTDSPSPKEKV